ncbi:MAG: ATPase, T2SS/T4P/T4SS family [Candidatus Omnitrophica bacterium]|nr:ATPase, T2SS/T4P/T4SS family [Candidatus Omnitrophota bacterium]MDD5352849.1 ATPase, T2SS/T4P/T4SS family [Candidatus Omnitrophota bacterium]MDD5550448.1 ATPase, T2SS/T4P/T4SS family [Candidatus Omnitrophota bacterium]
MNKFQLDIQAKVLEQLFGKINIMQTQEEKDNIVINVLADTYGNTTKDNFFQGKTVSELNTDEGRKSFLKEFFSFGTVDELLVDPNTEDIIINALNPIYVHHTYRGLVKTDKKFNTQKELDVFVKKLLVFSGRKHVKMVNNLELPNISGRVNIVQSPFGPQITITKIKESPLSIIDLVNFRSLSYELAAQLWLYVEGMGVRPANMLILGAPGSGKTTLMNALISFIPDNERLVVIEDTLELNTKLEDSWSRLECDEGITLADLVKNSLRMRPERIIVGEVRGSEAQDMMTAMNIGKYCMGTIHANSAREAIIRLQNEPMNIPETLVNLIDVFVTVKKYQIRNSFFRVVDEIAETAGLEQKVVLLSPVWSYNCEKENFIERQPSSVFRDKVCKLGGFPAKNFIDEFKIRVKLLKILKEKEMNKIDDVSSFCRLYHRDREAALNKLNLTKEHLLGD